MRTVSVMPPDIIQQFSAVLLSVPMNHWCTAEEWLEKWAKEIRRKYKPGGRKTREVEELLSVYRELYEWQKAEKEYCKAERKEEAKRPDPPIDKIHKVKGVLGGVLRSAFKDFATTKRTGT